MDAVSYAHSAKQAQRIEKFIENPDSASGIVTVPKTIASGETITIPAGRVAILPNVLVEGDLLVEGTVFIPTGSTYTQETIKTEAISNVAGSTTVNVTDIVSRVGNQDVGGVKNFTSSPTTPTPTAGDNSTKVATTAYVDGKMVRGTSVASTSGTSIDFTGIPSWTKKITVMMKDISTSGVSSLLIQIGNTTIQTTGYNSSSGGAINATVPAVLGSTTGFIIINDVASDAFTAIMEIHNITGNSYIEKYTRGGTTGRVIFGCGAGSVTLSGILDRIRITTVNGTDTFDAGQINIMYEV